MAVINRMYYQIPLMQKFCTCCQSKIEHLPNLFFHFFDINLSNKRSSYTGLLSSRFWWSQVAGMSKAFRRAVWKWAVQTKHLFSNKLVGDFFSRLCGSSGYSSWRSPHIYAQLLCGEECRDSQEQSRMSLGKDAAALGIWKVIFHMDVLKPFLKDLHSKWSSLYLQ